MDGVAETSTMPRGCLRRAADGAVVPFESRWLDDGDLDELHALHARVVEGVPHPHMFRADSRDFMARQLDRRGRTVGVLADGRLVAYAAISFPDDDPDNLGRDLEVTRDRLHTVADYDGSAVDPAFRGNGLQRTMSEVRNAWALAQGRHHILGTVSPLNPVSLHTFLSLGFLIRGLKPKYGGALRYIIHRDLTQPAPPAPVAAVEVPMADVDRQLDLLAAGHVGVAVAFDRYAPRLRLGRPAHAPAARAA
jgi:GNAT superfamily N-acetyltransferase